MFKGLEFALNERIKRSLENKRIAKLKKGLYTTDVYYLKEPNKTEFKEFIASKLKFPSYLSSEYVLSKYNLLTEATYPLTSITLKTGHSYQNSLGTYKYSNIKEAEKDIDLHALKEYTKGIIRNEKVFQLLEHEAKIT